MLLIIPNQYLSYEIAQKKTKLNNLSIVVTYNVLQSDYK